jgi:RNA polymerase sigma factor (sigma-70 family)
MEQGRSPVPEKLQSDAELIRGHLAGDASAFEALANRHAPMVYRACLRLLGDAHEAEDATQAVFVILARKASRFRKGGDMAAWLHGISRRVASEARRAGARRKRREEEGAMLKAASSGGELPAADRAAALEALDREVGALPARERQAVVLRYLEGNSLSQAAKIADCPEGTLGRRAHDGLARLRSRLGGRGAMLGTAALAALLESEAAAALPASLVPSVVTASKLAVAAGATAGAGAVGAKAILLAEGTMKAMMLFKIKVVAAAVLTVAVAAGAAVPVIRGPARMEERKGPGAEAKPGNLKNEGANWGRAVNGLRTSLAADKVAYAKGDTITLTLTFENLSRKPQRIHAYMLNYWHLKWSFEGEIRQLQRRVKFRLAAPREQNFPVLKPGGKTSFSFKSSGTPPSFSHAPVITTTSLTNEGEYRIQVTYENQRNATVAGRALDNIWKGSLSSNKVAFRIGGGKFAWGQAANGLQAGLVPLGGEAAKGWIATECPDCGKKNRKTNAFSRSMAARKRACHGCGKAKPRSATFVEGKPMRLEVHLRNVSKKLIEAPWAHCSWEWRIVFTSRKTGMPRLARYSGPMPKLPPGAKLPTLKLSAGKYWCEVLVRGKKNGKFEYCGAKKIYLPALAALPPGKYTVTATYAYANPKVKKTHWTGRVSTAPVEIEIKARGADDLDTRLFKHAQKDPSFTGLFARYPRVQIAVQEDHSREGKAGELRITNKYRLGVSFKGSPLKGKKLTVIRVANMRIPPPKRWVKGPATVIYHDTASDDTPQKGGLRAFLFMDAAGKVQAIYTYGSSGGGKRPRGKGGR